MGEIELKRSGELAYREAGTGADPTAAAVVLVHGFPESSRMWEPVMTELAAAGRRCAAPDLYALGDSTGPLPATYETNLKAFGAWVGELGLDRIALVVHDWGGFIGLTWACQNPDRVEALVISDTGFFADGKWHGMAEAMRGEQGESLVAALDRDGFAGLLRSSGEETFSDGDIDAYWAPFAEGRGRQATLDFYRSMDFDKLSPWQGKLAELGVPVLLLWGADDPFAPLAGAHRFEREIPGSRLVAIEGAGHFVFDERRADCAREVAAFLAG